MSREVIYMTTYGKTVQVRMTTELYTQLKCQADATCRTVPAYIRQVLDCYLWHLEHCPDTLADWRIAAK